MFTMQVSYTIYSSTATPPAVIDVPMFDILGTPSILLATLWCLPASGCC